MTKLKNSYFSYFLMINFYYLSWALFSCLISVYLLDRGLKTSQVSLIVSASFLASMLVQPVIGILCDRFDTKRVNIGLFILAAIGGIFFLFASQFWSMLIGYSFVLALINGANPIMEKIAASSPFPYGKIRIWGTIGYAAGSQLSGIIYEHISPQAVFLTFLASILLAVVGTSLTQPELKQKTQKEVQEKTSYRDLLTNPKFLYFLLLSCIYSACTSMANTYIPAMFVHDGLSVSFSSTILSIAVFFETPIVLFSGKFMDRLSNKTLILLSFTMTCFQLAVLGFNLPLSLKVITTLLTKHTASMLFIMINLKVVHTVVPEKMILTALAFVATAKNLVSIVSQNAAGQLLDVMSYSQVFQIFFFVLLIGLLLAAFYRVPKGPNERLFS